MNSNDFARSGRQLRKKYNYEAGEAFLRDLQELFLKALGQPDELSAELFEYCCGSEFSDASFDKLADMVDLFGMDFEGQIERLSGEDWSLLRELVNSWAQDMDMDVVTYVMQMVVSSGEFR